MSGTKNVPIRVFPTALQALPSSGQGLVAEAWRDALGWLIHGSARAPDHITIITGMRKQGSEEWAFSSLTSLGGFEKPALDVQGCDKDVLVLPSH